MMKMIKPVVNISKVMEPYNTVIVGFRGVVTEGNNVKQEAVSALVNMKKAGKRIVLVSNSPLRVEQIARFLHANKVPLAVFDAIVSAGEILHYRFKSRKGDFAAVGNAYFQMGSRKDTGIFCGLDYFRVDSLAKADFIYMSEVSKTDDLLENYLPQLEHAASLGMPFVCAGNDTSSYMDGQICLSTGAFAEQYAVLGGKIITVGKPDVEILSYATEELPDFDKEKTLLIGDNLATDIKGANLLGISSALVSKGVHVNFLGEGYIPDVAKTRELATNFDAYPDFIISNLRW